MDLPAPSAAAWLFAGVTDPRVERTRRHLLCDILLIVLCATLAGPEGFCDIAEWAQTKEGWLRTFLALSGGAIPIARASYNNSSASSAPVGMTTYGMVARSLGAI